MRETNDVSADKTGQPNPPPERNATFIEGGANPLPRQPAGQPPQFVDRSGTMIETEEDVRQALLSGLKGQPPIPVSVPAAAPPPMPAAVRQPSPVGEVGQPVPADGPAADRRS